MIITIAAGKGGTGKTLVATSLALSIDNVQFIDCDVEEPDAHILLRPEIFSRKPVFIPVPQVDEEKCTGCGKCSEVCVYHAIAVFSQRVLIFPELCHGCGACVHLCPENAISEEGMKVGVVESGKADGIEFIQGKLDIGKPMPTPVIREVKREINPKRTVIIDVAPGTSCPMAEAVKGSDFCILVTEPTPFGLYDLKLAIEVVKKLKVNFGVIINRDGIGDYRLEDYCKSEEIPVLLKIPFQRKIAELYSKGVSLVSGMPEWKEDFNNLFREIKEAR
ncbi:MAG: ATP-binding protein [archaeon]|nr:ATP-binding protein [archaeon]